MSSFFQSIRKEVLSKGPLALGTLMLCLSLLGMQSLGLFHSVVHANSVRVVARADVFAQIENADKTDWQAAKLACQLLGDVLLAVGLGSADFKTDLLVVTHTTAVERIQAQYLSPPLGAYKARAPPLHFV